jgi:plasmid stabilization system protein ParE
MSRRAFVRIDRRAAREIEEAAAWWRTNRPAAPEAFEENLTAALDLLATQPIAGSGSKSSRLRGVRRVYLSRVRYHLYYRADIAGGKIDVLACWHASRGRSPQLPAL